MKLKDYLEKEGLKLEKFAKKIGKSRVTLYRWLNGITMPDELQQKAIEKITKGQVTLKDWKEEKIDETAP